MFAHVEFPDELLVVVAEVEDESLDEVESGGGDDVEVNSLEDLFLTFFNFLV